MDRDKLLTSCSVSSRWTLCFARTSTQSAFPLCRPLWSWMTLFCGPATLEKGMAVTLSQDPPTSTQFTGEDSYSCSYSTNVSLVSPTLFKWWPARPMLGLLYVSVFQLLTISRAATNILHIQRPWVETKYPPTPNNTTITTTTTTNKKKKKNQKIKWSDLRGKMKLNFKLNFSTMKM